MKFLPYLLSLMSIILLPAADCGQGVAVRKKPSTINVEVDDTCIKDVEKIDLLGQLKDFKNTFRYDPEFFNIFNGLEVLNIAIDPDRLQDIQNKLREFALKPLDTTQISVPVDDFLKMIPIEDKQFYSKILEPTRQIPAKWGWQTIEELINTLQKKDEIKSTLQRIFGQKFSYIEKNPEDIQYQLLVTNIYIAYIFRLNENLLKTLAVQFCQEKAVEQQEKAVEQVDITDYYQIAYQYVLNFFNKRLDIYLQTYKENQQLRAISAARKDQIEEIRQQQLNVAKHLMSRSPESMQIFSPDGKQKQKAEEKSLTEEEKQLQEMRLRQLEAEALRKAQQKIKEEREAQEEALAQEREERQKAREELEERLKQPLSEQDLESLKRQRQEREERDRREESEKHEKKAQEELAHNQHKERQKALLEELRNRFQQKADDLKLKETFKPSTLLTNEEKDKLELQKLAQEEKTLQRMFDNEFPKLIDWRKLIAEESGWDAPRQTGNLVIFDSSPINLTPNNGNVIAAVKQVVNSHLSDFAKRAEYKFTSEKFTDLKQLFNADDLLYALFSPTVLTFAYEAVREAIGKLHDATTEKDLKNRLIEEDYRSQGPSDHAQTMILRTGKEDGPAKEKGNFIAEKTLKKKFTIDSTDYIVTLKAMVFFNPRSGDISIDSSWSYPEPGFISGVLSFLGKQNEIIKSIPEIKDPKDFLRSTKQQQ